MKTILTPCLVKIGIPFTAVGIITFVIVGGLAFLFLRWWFKRRNARTVTITKIVSSKNDLQQGQLYREGDTLYTVDKNEAKTFDIKTIKTAIVSQVENSQQGYYHYKLQFVTDEDITISIDGNLATQPFFNEILFARNKPTVDWTKPFPVMRKIGGMTIKGYRIAV